MGIYGAHEGQGGIALGSGRIAFPINGIACGRYYTLYCVGRRFERRQSALRDAFPKSLGKVMGGGGHSHPASIVS